MCFSLPWNVPVDDSGVILHTKAGRGKGARLGPRKENVKIQAFFAAGVIGTSRRFDAERAINCSRRFARVCSLFALMMNQADIRLKRPFNIGRLQLEGQFDAYNAFNSGVVLSRVQTFGSALDRPATILQGRLIRLGVQARW